MQVGGECGCPQSVATGAGIHTEKNTSTCPVLRKSSIQG